LKLGLTAALSRTGGGLPCADPFIEAWWCALIRFAGVSRSLTWPASPSALT